MPKTTKPRPSSKEFEVFGNNIIALYETGYLNKKAAYKQTIIKGMLAGLGGVIGATVMVAVLLWILSFFKSIPLIGPITNSINHSIESSKQ